MSHVVVSHAIEVGPDSIWYPHLRDELEVEGHTVELVRLPNPSAPAPDAWLQALTDATDGLPAADTVLVGHSLGGVNTLRFLQQHDPDLRGPFAGAVLVATMSHSVGYDALDGFFEPNFDWEAIRSAARRFHALLAIDDPVMAPQPVDHLVELVTGLGATGILESAGGHFPTWTPDTPPALTALPQAVRLVRDCLSADG